MTVPMTAENAARQIQALKRKRKLVMILNKRRKIRKTHRFHNIGTAQTVTKDFREHSAGVDHIDYNAYS